MFTEIFRFECRYQLRSPLFLFTALLFFTLAFLAMASEHVNIGGGTNNLNFNAPFTLIQSHLILSIVAMFAAVAFVATPLTRDPELKTEETLVATGVGRLPFLFGRFLGGYLFAVLAGSAAVLGSLVATFMPWLDAARLGPFAIGPYWFSIWAVMAPNLLIVCSLVALVAALTRSMLASYTVLVAVLIADVVVGTNTDQETIARMSLLDPFGLVAFEDVTRYWTVFDRNTLVPAVTGVLLVNRVLWLGIAAAAIGAMAWRFRFAPRTRRASRRRATGDAARVPMPSSVGDAAVVPAFGPALVVRQFVSQLRMDLRGVLTSFPFYVILFFGMFNVLAGFFGAISELFGTPVLPVTRMMLTIVDGSYVFVVFIVIVYYAGELVHRERQTGVATYVDAMPFPGGAIVCAKITALLAIVALTMLVVMLTSIAVQIGHGYYRLEIGTYLFGLFVVQSWDLYLFCVLAVCVQTMASNKFLGMLVLIAIFLTMQTLGSVGFEHVLYQLGVPQPKRSDMNGWGHYLEPMFTVGAYWTLWMVLAAVLAHVFMLRGTSDRWRGRLRVARARFTRRVGATTAVVALLIAGLGGWIFYNTNVLNRYETAEDREALQAQYEKRYKQYEDRPQPDAVALDTQVDIYPVGAAHRKPRQRRARERRCHADRRDRSAHCATVDDQSHRVAGRRIDRNRSAARVPPLSASRAARAGRDASRCAGICRGEIPASRTPTARHAWSRTGRSSTTRESCR